MNNNPYAKKRKAASYAITAATIAKTDGNLPAINRNNSVQSDNNATTTRTTTPVTTFQNNVTITNNNKSIIHTTATASSFSQAFEDVEDTNHYKKQLEQEQNAATGTTTTTTNLIRLRTEQREFDKKHSHHDNNNNKQQQQQSKEDYILANATMKQPTETNDHTSGIVSTTTTTGNSSTGLGFQNERDHHVLFQQPHVLYVSTKQRGNGILQYIRNVPITYQTMVPDYIFSTTKCALFLSIKYHNLYPTYILKRITLLKTDFMVRILLVLVDVDDNATVLLQLNKLCVIHNFTLVLSWSEEEAARYLETYKVMDGKDPKSIKKKEQTYFGDQVIDFLCTPKTGINKTDASLLLQQFYTIQNVSTAPIDELLLVSGMGETKVRKLYDAFHKPFSKHLSNQRRLRKTTTTTNETNKKNDDNSTNQKLVVQKDMKQQQEQVEEDEKETIEIKEKDDDSNQETPSDNNG